MLGALLLGLLVWSLTSVLGAGAVVPCTVSWDGGAGTKSWHDADNWSTDAVPGSRDKVCITQAGASVVFSEGAVTVAGMDMSQSLKVTGGATLTVGSSLDSSITGAIAIDAGTLELDSASTLNPSSIEQVGGTLGGSSALRPVSYSWLQGDQTGSGSMVVTGELTIYGEDRWHRLLDTRSITVPDGASARWAGGILSMSGGTRFDNAGTLTLSQSAQARPEVGTGQILNTGTWRTADRLTAAIQVPFTNDGSIEMAGFPYQAQMGFTDGSISGNPSDGTYSLGNGAAIGFAGAVQSFSSSTRISGSAASASFAADSARLPPGSKYDVQDTLVGAGTLDLDGTAADTRSDQLEVLGGQVNVNVTGGPLDLEALYQQSGYIGGTSDVRARLYDWTSGLVQGSGTIEVTGPMRMLADTQAHPGHEKGLRGSRTLRIDPGATTTWSGGSFAMGGGTHVENGGIFELTDDVAAALDPCCPGQATFHNAGTLRKSGGTGSSSVGIDVTNDGAVDALSGTLRLSRLTNYDPAKKSLTGGSYLAVGGLGLPGEVVENAADVTLDGDSAELLDPGDGNALHALARNLAGGALVLRNGHTLATSGGLTNAGAITIGAGSTLSSAGEYLQTGGTTRLAAGDAHLAASAGVRLDGGVMDGIGTVDASLANSAELAPGMSPGILRVTGDYIQRPAGLLRLEIGGTAAGSEHDQLAVGGRASLAGALTLETVAGFVPHRGDSFTLLTHSRENGQFDTVSGLDVDADHSYSEPMYSQTETVIRGEEPPTVSVTGPPAAVVEGDSGASDAVFTVSLSAASAKTIQVQYATLDESATATSDYQSSAGELTFAPGDTRRTVTVKVQGDTLIEGDERFAIQLVSAQSATIEHGFAQATIADDDRLVSEGGSMPSGGASPACPDTRRPTSTVRRAALTRHALSVSGVAADRACGGKPGRVALVGVSIGLRRRDGTCRYVQPSGELGRPVRCGKVVYLPVAGRHRWKLALRARLRRGRYEIRSRATDAAGNVENGRRAGRRRVLRVRVK